MHFGLEITLYYLFMKIEDTKNKKVLDKSKNCEGEKYKKFLIGNLIQIHMLLRYKNGCGMWNHDYNGSKNIYKTPRVS